MSNTKGIKMKYYAVKKGRKTGVFPTWAECEKQVKGFSGAIYKSFPSLAKAKTFISAKTKKQQVKPKPVAKKKWTKKDYADYYKESRGLDDRPLDYDRGLRYTRNTYSGKKYIQVGRED